MRIFILMMQLFTRIPIEMELPIDKEDFYKGIKYFPLVGLVIGCLDALCYLVMIQLCPKNIAILLVCLFNILMTGAFHLDGLADTCDGIFSARPKEKILEIMKDSRIGTNGTIAIFFDLTFKIVFLLQTDASMILQSLIVAPVIGKTGMVILSHTCQPARKGGLGELFIGKTSNKDLLIGIGICVIVTGSLLFYRAVAVLGINLAAIAVYRKYIVRKMDGMTGDTLGAANEWGEVVALASLALLP